MRKTWALRRFAVALVAASLGAGGVSSIAAFAGGTGPTWGTAVNVDESSYSPTISGLSCISTSWCMGVNLTGQDFVLNGTSWSAPAQFDPSVNGNGGGVTSVSCTSTTFCAAVDSDGYALTYNGTVWDTPGLLDGSGTSGNSQVAINSVSCAAGATDTICWAVDANGNGFEYDANTGKWSAAVKIVPAPNSTNGWTEVPSLTSVSCPTVTFCVAVDNGVDGVTYSGNAYTWNGTSWSTPDTIGGANGQGEALEAVSCTSSTFCMTVENGGLSASYNGTSWSPAQLILPSNEPFNAISCASTTLCAATPNAANASTYLGAVVMYENGTWAAPQTVDKPLSQGGTDLHGVSCVTTTFCVAGDGNGDAFYYGTPGSSSSTTSSSSTSSTSSTTSSSSTSTTSPGGKLSSASCTQGSGTVGVAYTGSCSASGGTLPYSWSVSSGTLPTGLSLNSSTGAITGTPTAAGNSSAMIQVADSSSPPETMLVPVSITVAAATPPPSGPGYWLLGTDGTVYPFGSATNVTGNATNMGNTAVAIAPTPDGKGYWVVSSTGTVDNFGDAGSYSLSAQPAASTSVTTIASTADGKGFWLATNAGQVITAGDAVSYGSPAATSGLHLTWPIVNMFATPDGKGYWLMSGDGGIFTYGDATFEGTPGQLNPANAPGGANSVEPLNKPTVAMSPSADGKGYWEVAADGGIFTFGDAAYHGSTGQLNPAQQPGGSNSVVAGLVKPIDGMVPTSTGGGYWMVAGDGGIFAFGDAGFVGSLGGKSIPAPIVAMAGDPA